MLLCCCWRAASLPGAVNDAVDDAAMLLPDRLGADEAGRGGERVVSNVAKCSAKLVLLLDAHDIETIEARSGDRVRQPGCCRMADHSTR